MADEPQDAEFDLVIVRCTDCKRTREFELAPRIVGAEALHAWLKGLRPCRCRAATCEVKVRIHGRAS